MELRRQILGMVAIIAAVAPTVEPVPAQEIEPIVRGVFRIIEPNSRGSGFAVAPTVLATNYHVISNSAGALQEASALRVTQGNRAWAVSRIIWSNRQLDLALIEVPGLDAGSLPIAVTTMNRLQQVVAIGFPGGADRPFQGRDFGGATATEGTIGRLLETPLRREIQHSAHVSPGNSGGPLIDRCGRVVGVNTHVGGTRSESGTLVQTPGIYFAVDARHLAEAMQQLGIVVRPQANRCEQSDASRPSPADVQRWQELAERARRDAEAARAALAQLRQDGGIDRQKLAQAEERLAQAEAQMAQATQLAEDLRQQVQQRTLLLALASGGSALVAGFALAIAMRRSRQQLVRVVNVSSRVLTGHSLNLRPWRRSAGAPAWRLVGHTGTGEKVSLRIDEADGRAVIGRSPRLADRTLGDDTLSRRHARLLVRRGQLAIEDLGSANGTRINRQRIAAGQPHPVSVGDEVRLGRVRLRVEAGDGPAAAAD